MYYQLNERVSFIAPKDKIVAQLLFDLGNTAYLLGNYTNSLNDYKEAKKYGFTGQIIEPRILEAERLSKLPEQESQHNFSTKDSIKKIWILGFVLIGTIMSIIYKRKKKKNS